MEALQSLQKPRHQAGALQRPRFPLQQLAGPAQWHEEGLTWWQIWGHHSTEEIQTL